ncbi:MAG: hypothetical protein WD042_09220 [Phycisphaeraceae bacterium]
MKSPLRIITTGMAVTYPFGGVFWDYMQYPLGLHKLGHEVLYLEDTGKWCYDPAAQTWVEDGSANAAAFANHLAKLSPELAQRWHYRDVSGKTHGWDAARVAEFCRSADLLLHISASCWLRDDYLKVKRIAFVDSDPMYTQASLFGGDDPAKAAEKLKWWTDHHQVFFTFGEKVGQADCLVPTGPIKWRPTRQPVVLDAWQPARVPVAQRRQVLTTVASWEPTEKGPSYGGVQYGGKSTEFARFIDLPAHLPVPIEVALSGPAPHDRLRQHGWQVRDGLDVSRDPWLYRAYLANSLAECSVAKNAYVASRSGWFSCRSACYLALGVPAIVQDTGWSDVIQPGAGLVAFTTIDEAADAIRRLAADPQRHAKAALEVAHEWFAADRVLANLLVQAA